MNKPHKGFKRVLALPDIHYPYHDQRALDAVFKYVKDEWFDEAVQLGDLLDFSEISDWNRGKPGLTENMRVQDTFDAGNEFWYTLQNLTWRNNPKCKHTYLEGNHEQRIERLYARHPIYTGMFDVEHWLELKRRSIKWVRCDSKGEIHKVGQLYFTHGYSANLHHALSTVRAVGAHIRYGHTHDRQYTADKRIGHNQAPTAASLGCLCDLNQPYLKGGPTRWEHGFGVFDFYPDGAFQEHYVRLHDYQFIGPTNGKLYKS